MTGTCDVHRIVYRDQTPREDVRYCKICGAWICPACRPRVDLRMLAAIMKFGEQHARQ